MSRQDLSGRLFLVMLEILLLSDCVQGGGQLSLRLLSYTHPSGQLVSHQCCDNHQQQPQQFQPDQQQFQPHQQQFQPHQQQFQPHQGQFQPHQQQTQQPTCDPGLCDPYFVIRIHEVNEKVQSGFNISFRTGTLRNTASVNFTGRIGGIINPLNSSFGYWPGAAEISVDIWDDNSDGQGSDGLINSLKITHPQRMATNDENSYTQVAAITDNTTTTVLVEINLKCDEGCHYDAFCYKCCVPMDNATGHISCDTWGTAHCRPGWKGSTKLLCPEPICTPPCPKYSTCQAVMGHQTCVCNPQQSDADCQQPRTTSLTSKATTTPTTPTTSTTSKPTTSTTTTTTTSMTTTTTTTTAAKPTAPSPAHKTEDRADDCFLLVCYIFIPLICLLALTIIAIVVALVMYYVGKRKEKEKETKVEPFRSLDF